MTYTQQHPQTCGPAAYAFAAGISEGCARTLFKWHHHGGLAEDMQDSPLHHFSVMERTGQRWRIRTCEDILNGRFAPHKVVCLVHLYDREPPAWMPRFLARIWQSWTATLRQHWVVVAGIINTPERVFVRLHWGDGTIRDVPEEEFERIYSLGAPACAYEVGIDGDRKLVWWERWYVKIANWIF